MVAPKEIIYAKNLYDDEKSRAEIKRLLLTKGKFLLDSVTGSGKTYAIIKVMQELSKEYKDKVFIIACPNKIQNIQNGKEYKVTVIVGEDNKKRVQTYECITVASIVYDKALSILEERHLLKKDITIVVDEAHQLIYGKNFRRKAIESILELEKCCFNVIHLSATTRALKQAYSSQYDEIITMNPSENINNINRLMLMKCDDKQLSLFRTIDSVFKSGSKVLLYLNNKAKIKDISELLQLHYKDKNIKTLHRDSSNKINDTEIFNSITEKSLIPGGIDILIVTSFIECGTNLKNENIVPVLFVDSNKNFNLDGCIQFFARPRNKVDIGFLIYEPSKKENEYLSIDNIIKLETEYVNKTLKDIEDMFRYMCNKVGIEQATIFINGMLKDDTPYDHSYSKGYIYFNEDTLEFKCDRELFYKYCFDRHDIQLLNHDETLLSSLIGSIKANSIEIIKHSKEQIILNDKKLADEFKDTVKESKAQLKEYRTELKNELIKVLEDKDNKAMFIEYSVAEDELSKDLYRNHSKKELKVVLEQLEQDKKVLENINKCINKYNDTLKLIYSDDEIIRMYVKGNLQEQTLKSEQYRIWNTLVDSSIKIDTRYSIIRNTLDNFIQKRLSRKTMLSLYNGLYPKNKKDKLTPKVEEKLINEIKLIYNLTETEKSYYITSLKK